MKGRRRRKLRDALVSIGAACDACDWELDRRAAVDYPLRPPEAAIPPEEDAVSIDAAAAMRATFAQDSPAVGALFDALVQLLVDPGRKY